MASIMGFGVGLRLCALLSLFDYNFVSFRSRFTTGPILMGGYILSYFFLKTSLRSLWPTCSLLIIIFYSCSSINIKSSGTMIARGCSLSSFSCLLLGLLLAYKVSMAMSDYDLFLIFL